MTEATAADFVHPEHEEFHFLRWGFDITRIRASIARSKTPLPRMQIPVAEASRLLASDPELTPESGSFVPLIGVDVRWDHVDELPDRALEAPLFAGDFGELGTIVIDGWHRIALARRRGIAQLPALVIDRRRLSRYRLPRSPALPPPKRPNQP